MPSAEQPESIGPYRIIRELGRGAMGVVYHAEDPTIGRGIAVKVVRFDQALNAEQNAQLRLRLMREASAAGKLNHPGIVTVYQLGEEGNIVYIAMEFVPGVSLEHLLAQGPLREAGTLFRILRDVAEALDYAHAGGIVHRDIKPGNILVRDDGRAKIADFGIAKTSAHGLTQTGTVVGTPTYMAPEQIMAAQIDGRADQFSLGVMAFLMLSGRPPFKADSMPGLIFQIVQSEPPPLHEIATQYSAAATAVLGRALAKKPAERFPTCLEFVETLESACRARAPSPAPAPAPARTQAFPVQPPAAEPLRSAPTPPLPTARRPGWLWAALTGLAVVVALAGITLGARWLRPAPTSAPAPAVARVPPPPVEAAGPEPRRVNPLDGLTYVRIPAGRFEMGCAGGERRCKSDTLPVREVEISQPFYLASTEITATAYARFAAPAPQGEGPAVNVTWDDARRYCEWAGGRLPSEAEWEYAARAGEPGAPPEPVNELAWYQSNSQGRSQPVGGKAANAFGLHDMLGNVWEWTADRYSPSYYRLGVLLDPPGPEQGREAVVRGGSASTSGAYLSYSTRFSFPPETQDATLGFRCVTP